MRCRDSGESGEENDDTRIEIFRQKGFLEEGMRRLWVRQGWEEEVILVLHFINFTAISGGMVESKDRETCSLVSPLG